MVEVLAPRVGLTGLVATLAKWGATVIDVTSGVGAITKYTVGPAFSGAEFTTWQAAIDQAVLDGHGSSSVDRARFELYPGLYLEDVVVPSALRYWDVQGAGNRYGTFVNSLTVVRDTALGQTFWTLDQISTGAYTVTDAGAGANTSASMLTNVWFFGTVNVNVPGHTMRCYDAEFGSSATPLIFVGTRLELAAGCRVDAGGSTNVAVNSNGFTRLQDTYIFGRVVVAGSTLQMLGCVQYSAGAAAVADACTAFSEIYNNAFHQNGAATAGYYSKTGASQLTEGGNVFPDQAIAPFFTWTGAGVFRTNEVNGLLSLTGNPALSVADCAGVDELIVEKADAGGIVTLPSLATVPRGKPITVKDKNGFATASPITIAGAGADTIDGAATITIAINNGSRTVVAGIGGWSLVAGANILQSVTRVNQIYPRSFTAQVTSTNTIHLMRFVASRDETVQQIGLFVASPSGLDTVLYGIYASGLTTLLAQGSFTPSVAGWAGHALSGAVLTAGAEYWLAVKGTIGAASFGGDTTGLVDANNLRSLFDAGGTLPASAAAATAAGTWFSSYVRGIGP